MIATLGVLPAVAAEDASPAQASNSDVKSLDELLQLIKTAKVRESKEHRQRERAFKADKNQQAQLLQQAQVQKAEQEARSAELESTFADNERELEALQAQMQNRLGTLKELFGHITAAAGDTVTRLDRSLVSAQYPGRSAQLNELIEKMSSHSRLPSLEEIENLAYEMSREMVESGRVSRFNQAVISADGEQVERQVIRIGLFNLISNGHYLSYNPDNGVLAELARQPRGLAKGAAALQLAESGFTPLSIDPSGPVGGGLLRALADRPGLAEKWQQGGLVGYVITGIGAVALVLALWRAFVLRGVFAGVRRQLQEADTYRLDNPLGRVLSVADAHAGLDPESMELKLHEAILKERPAIELALNLLKIIAMIAPLMGLLGTVTGMIVVFQQITIFGAGDPKLMAGGISQALVTTVLGLLVAIPTLLLHTWVNGYARRILHVLEEQSAGIVALKAEARLPSQDEPSEKNRQV
ncbi:MAG: MotA/TolQ/ExbB proton channel family protein [Gammaproteobacteria bacterium]|nr:MotA/TolQ/ExbB proton channel family protein [Gammaproteobacteria bacterium]MBQ0839213.1 MotA/TolQ/ExbB proton channel family protein [Gammaproteobacteria bacterium]